MIRKPTVKLGDWIVIGDGPRPRQAVVCTIYDDSSLADLEVVYLSDRNQAINDDVVWRNGTWEFRHSGPSGGYADKYDRLTEFVSLLRMGRR